MDPEIDCMKGVQNSNFCFLGRNFAFLRLTLPKFGKRLGGLPEWVVERPIKFGSAINSHCFCYTRSLLRSGKADTRDCLCLDGTRIQAQPGEHHHKTAMDSGQFYGSDQCAKSRIVRPLRLSLGFHVNGWDGSRIHDGLVNDHSCNAFSIGFLFRCVDTVVFCVHCQTMHFLLNWKILQFSIVVWIVHLENRNGAA